MPIMLVTPTIFVQTLGRITISPTRSILVEFMNTKDCLFIFINWLAEIIKKSIATVKKRSIFHIQRLLTRLKKSFPSSFIVMLLERSHLTSLVYTAKLVWWAFLCARAKRKPKFK